MARTLERVRVADCLPLVDEYGNEFLNRDYSLDVNKAYVDELAASFKDGEPDEPIRVVRDGDKYRIRAGNSRVRAMRQLGTEECWAVVDDEGTVQAINETVVRTNVKKKYEPLEESRFVQQLAMFGDDEYVGQVSCIGADNAASLRRACAAAGERAGQMTLDQLFIVDEFDGFPELQRKVMDVDGDLRYKVDGLRREKRDIVQRNQYVLEARNLGIELVADRPDGKQYIFACKEPGDLSAKYMEASVDYKGIVGRLGSAWNGVYVDFYGEPLDEGKQKEEAEAAERRRKVEDFDRVLDAVDDSTLMFVRNALAVENLKPETRLKKLGPGLLDRAAEKFADNYVVHSALTLIPEAKGYGVNFVPAFAIGYNIARFDNPGPGVFVIGGRPLPEYHRERCEKWLGWVDLHVAAGWKPDDGEAAAIELLRAKVAEAGEPEGDGE